MKVLDSIYRIIEKVKSIGIFIGGIFIFVMMFAIVADVFSRNFLFGSIRGTTEFVQHYFMPLAIFPGLAYVYSTGILPKMEIILDKLKGRYRALIINALLLIEFILFSILIYYTFQFALNGVALQTSFTAGGTIYSYYHLFFIIPVVFTVVNIEIAMVFIKNLIKKRGEYTYYTIQELAEGDKM